MRHELVQRGCAGIEVASAGTWGLEGAAATSHAVDVMATRDVDISTHHARQLTARELAAADLVVAMTTVHVREVAATDLRAESKTVLLKQLAETDVEALAAEASPQERLASLLRGGKPIWRRDHDVDDPMGFPAPTYERCATYLEAGVRRLADLLCGAS